ncbi:hypothetical protein FCK90_04350 [Kocuria coralli]|uniref:Uncharacterized protein n=1 Tax=Kocuria coralli TaxID=1461025 RepID=A0A5J5KYP0_9MICC|nr:hypothetical protein [Kocuria coralli]KAA9394774.1 hypothetical protein FCK90_04350 [Kocuria coralli]
MADVWDSSLPYDDGIAAEKRAYCDANDLGDWANGVDPWDLSQYGGPTYEEHDYPTQNYGDDFYNSRDEAGLIMPDGSNADGPTDLDTVCSMQDQGVLTSGEMQLCHMEGY